MSAPERRWSMRKIEAGDWLLLGNDDRTWFRLTRGSELEPVRSGAGELASETTREVVVWEVWRQAGSVLTDLLTRGVDVLEWEHWEPVASWLPSRAEAIREALRLSTR